MIAGIGRSVLAVVLLGSTVGCASGQPTKLIQRKHVPLIATSARVALPELDKEVIAQVGDNMIEGGTVYTRPAIRLLESVTHTGFSVAPYTIHIPAGVLIGASKPASAAVQGTFFEAQQPLQFTSKGSFLVKGGVFVYDAEGVTPDVFWYATDTGVPLIDKDPTIRFERTTHEEWKSDSFRRELVYNGRSGNTIRLLYREFSEERIRPAFSQEVTYDLAADETIGFKGARFKVSDADNIRIKYVVLHHFD